MSRAAGGVVVSALALGLRAAHLVSLALGLTLGATMAFFWALELTGPLMTPQQAMIGWGAIAAIVSSWAALMGWLMGELCWRAVREGSPVRPSMAGRARAALLGVIFAGAAPLVLPLVFIAHSLWLMIPLTMIEGRALPDALRRARELAARQRRALLIDQASLALCGLVPFGLALLAAYASSFVFRGDWSGLAVAVFGGLMGIVAAMIVWCWALVGAGVLYARHGAPRVIDAEALAEVFA